MLLCIIYFIGREGCGKTTCNNYIRYGRSTLLYGRTLSQGILAVNQFRIHVLKQLQYFTHCVHHRPDKGDCSVWNTVTLKLIHQTTSLNHGSLNCTIQWMCLRMAAGKKAWISERGSEQTGDNSRVKCFMACMLHHTLVVRSNQRR